MKRFAKLGLKRTTFWKLLTGSILLGIGLSRTNFHGTLWLAGLIPFVLVFGRFRKLSISAAIVIMMLGFAVGGIRGHAYSHKVDVYNSLYFHKVTITAKALNDGVYNKKQQLTFDVNDVHSSKQALVGKLAVSGFGVSAIFQGDEVQVTGKLYPSRGSYQARISFAQITVLSHHASFIDTIRRSFIAGMQSALPEPIASFALGLLIGQRATLPDSVKQDLLAVGLTHIIAVSGYNLTIMLRASRNILSKRSKRLSTGFSLFLIILFLLLTGNSPSIVRAVIVSMLSIVTAYYGRDFKPLNLILIAAALTAWAKPAYVWGDLSWYLSFLAFYGVLVVAPLIASRWTKRYKNSVLLVMTLETLCAELMTLPIILYTFGQISFISLLANIVIAVFVPIAMLLCLIAGLAGMLISHVAGWFAWPGKIIATYMLDTAHILASLPHVFVSGIGFSKAQMLTVYGLILLITTSLWYKARAKSAKLTDRIQLAT